METQKQTEYLTVAETAKLLRKALKEAFPTTKFGVRSHSYSMGASITITYTDGPAEDAVKEIARQFEGAEFDGMIDLKSYKRSQYNGKEVQFGADYVFVERELSEEIKQKLAQKLAEENGLEFKGDLGESFELGNRFDNFATIVWRFSRDLSIKEINEFLNQKEVPKWNL